MVVKVVAMDGSGRVVHLEEKANKCAVYVAIDTLHSAIRYLRHHIHILALLAIIRGEDRSLRDILIRLRCYGLEFDITPDNDLGVDATEIAVSLGARHGHREQVPAADGTDEDAVGLIEGVS